MRGARPSEGRRLWAQAVLADRVRMGTFVFGMVTVANVAGAGRSVVPS